MVENTITPVADYYNYNITFSLPKRDLFIIGQTLSTKYVNVEIAPFINNINRSCVDANNLDADVEVTLTIQQLLIVVEKLGREPEFYYSSFNGQLKASLMSAINDMEDEDVQSFLITRFDLKQSTIETYKESLVHQYIQNQGLEISESEV